jgi:hypothetical protein
MIAVVCMKWGTAFGADYVNVLYRAVTRNLSYPFRFYCFTDDAAGLKEGIVARPIPDMSLPPERIRRGCWPKVGLFQPGLIQEDAALFLDLDIVITGSLDSFVERQRVIGGLHIIREWNPGVWNLLPLAWRPDRGGQSSVVCWSPEQQRGIYDSLMADPDAAFELAPNDQKHITRNAEARHYWPHSWTVSFKRTCVWYYPLSLIFKSVPRPKTAKIVVFHGKPRPSDLIVAGDARWGTKNRHGYGPVKWVRDYWDSDTGPNLGQGAHLPKLASTPSIEMIDMPFPALGSRLAVKTDGPGTDLSR